MTFEDFLSEVNFLNYNQSENDKLRYGQSIMNTLHRTWPEKYHEITGTDLDCFYDNSIVRFTLDKLEKEWSSKSL